MGRLERRADTPTFVSVTAQEIFEVDLVSMRIAYFERKSWAATVKSRVRLP